jgi:DNA-binding XRE family transcriptional regulator
MANNPDNPVASECTTSGRKKRQRNRGTLALSTAGKAAVRKAQALKGLTQQELADRSHVSVTTIKRLLQGKKVDPTCLNETLLSLGLELQDSLIQVRATLKEPIGALNAQCLDGTPYLNMGLQYGSTYPETGDSNTLPKRPPECSSLQGKTGVFMTGRFSQDKTQEVEMAVDHLKSLLIGGEVDYTEDGKGFTLRGSFEEEKRALVEQTLDVLENLCDLHKTTQKNQ